MIADSASFGVYVKQQAFLPLTEVFTEEELKQWEENCLTGKSEEDTKAQIYGIYLWDHPLLQELHFTAEKPVIGIVANTTRVEKAKETLRWFVKQGK